jgi:hypothetical protein
MNNHGQLKYGLENPWGEVVEKFRTIKVTEDTKEFFERRYGCELVIIRL